jgi:Methyltransferase domain
MGYSRVGRSRLLQCDVESMDRYINETFDIVYAYGVLYHLADPQAALEAMARRFDDLLLLETCVSFGANEAINHAAEPQSAASQSFQGVGC